MDGTEGTYCPRSESPVNFVDGQILNDFEVKIAPDEVNGVNIANGKQHGGAGDDTAENDDER